MATNGNGGGKAVRGQFIDELQGLIRSSQGMVFMDYQGLTSGEVYDLRKSLRGTGATLKVVKNRLMRIACEREKVAGCDTLLRFNTTVAFVSADVIPVLKSLTEFSSAHEKLKVKGGYLDGGPVSVEQISTLARLPGRTEMLTRAATAMKGPMARAARDFGSVLARLVLNMQAVINKGGLKAS